MPTPINTVSIAASLGGQNQSLSDVLGLVLAELQAIRKCLGSATGAGAGFLVGNITADVASIAAGAEGSQSITVTGAALGDFVLASITDAAPTSGSLDDAFLNARVSAADTVKINITNTHTATALDLSAAATFRVLVIPKAAAALPAMVLTA